MEDGREVWMTSSVHGSKVCDRLHANRGRQSLVSSLITAYGLTNKCTGIIPIILATAKELCVFHGKEYVDEILKERGDVWAAFTKDSDSKTEDETEDERVDFEKLRRLGLIDDCYPFKGMAEYVKTVAGSTISACKKMIEKGGNVICINWYGGRHHCSKNKASGYCYVNDIVLGINVLRYKYKKVFYLDLDLHHGDGVENAFKHSKNVITCSIHRKDIGFFPGTGTVNTEDIINIPTRRGLSPKALFKIIEIVVKVIARNRPDALVIQCGTDGLHTERDNEWNLTINSLNRALRRVITAFNGPTLLLGGGGYNHPEAAKCWTFITSKLLNQELHEEIPDHEYLVEYRYSGYFFWDRYNQKPSKMKDRNDDEYLEELRMVLLGEKRVERGMNVKV